MQPLVINQMCPPSLGGGGGDLEGIYKAEISNRTEAADHTTQYVLVKSQAECTLRYVEGQVLEGYGGA